MPTKQRQAPASAPSSNPAPSGSAPAGKPAGGTVAAASGKTPIGRTAKVAGRVAGGARKTRDTGRKVASVKRQTKETARNFGIRSGPSYKAAHKTLVYEMLLAEVVLALNWFFTPKQDGPSGSKVFTRATAIAMLYMVLALISDAGLIGARFSAGLGMVVVLGVVLDSAGLLTVLSNFTGNTATAGPEPTSPGEKSGNEGNAPGPSAPPKTPKGP